MALGFLCGLQGVSLAGVVALAPFYFILINYLYRFGSSAVRYPPENLNKGVMPGNDAILPEECSQKRSQYLAHSIVCNSTIRDSTSMRLWPYIFCCHACSFNFSPGRGACQPSPNLNENRTTQFCRLMQLTSFMTSLFYFVLLFSPCKIILMKGQGRLLH